MRHLLLLGRHQPGEPSLWWLRTFSDRYKCHGETTKVTAVFGACSGQTRSAPHSRERGEVVERRLAHTPRTFAFVAAAASAMAEVATPVVGSQDDTAGAEVEGAEAERSLASSPAVTGPRVGEEDITEIVTEGEAKAGHGFFRTSRGALRCGRCRSCSNRSLKRRCDLLEPPRHATGAPSKHRRHPPKPHGDDDANADADGDADNPHRAFATWQRRTLFEEDENADPAKAKFAWRRVTHARNSRSRCRPSTRRTRGSHLRQQQAGGAGHGRRPGHGRGARRRGRQGRRGRRARAGPSTARRRRLAPPRSSGDGGGGGRAPANDRLVRRRRFYLRRR